MFIQNESLYFAKSSYFYFSYYKTNYLMRIQASCCFQENQSKLIRDSKGNQNCNHDSWVNWRSLYAIITIFSWKQAGR